MSCKAILAAVFLTIFSITPCCSVIEEHLIEKLPGWRGPLPSLQYSGYIKLDPVSGKEFFYWFVFSENDPMNDPVVLWLNGGPGCSSLYGFFQENGPIRISLKTARNVTTPVFNKNPYGWAKIANVLYLESPTGAGFSYSTDTEDYTMDDDQTARDNFDFLLNFFDFYSEFKQNDFYITGESYAGIYIPMLAEIIGFMNDYLPSSRRINLKGLMIGNGCIGNEIGSCGLIPSIEIDTIFYHGHALVSNVLYHKIMQTCDFTQLSLSLECIELIYQMTSDIGNINIYDIYDTCPSSLSLGPDPSYHAEMTEDPLKTLVTSSSMYKGSEKEYGGPISCIDELAMDYYLNDDTVRAAIHAKSVEEIGTWYACSSKMTYIKNIASLLDVYFALAAKYRTVIYNGDVDACVPFVGAQEWTSNLGFSVKEKWRPWWVENKIAGYVTTYDVNNFTFITIKGSGHMVPHYKPKQAFAMFKRYLNKKQF